ncbi:MAG: ACP phosphodiesterase [Chitinophagaceae bacterium]
MNYLAHAYLSFNNPNILIGNMMGDWVKGNQKDKYPLNIQKGIQLHKIIDKKTDQNSKFQEAVRFLKPAYPLSAPIFMDIFFDYFLANNLIFFNDQNLKTFTQETYTIIEKNHHHLSVLMFSFFTNMINYDWLYQYKFKH